MCYVEVKSLGSVQHGIALFPDAPTERGRTHLHGLAQLARSGTRAVLLFVAARAGTGGDAGSETTRYSRRR